MYSPSIVPRTTMPLIIIRFVSVHVRCKRICEPTRTRCSASRWEDGEMHQTHVPPGPREIADDPRPCLGRSAPRSSHTRCVIGVNPASRGVLADTHAEISATVCRAARGLPPNDGAERVLEMEVIILLVWVRGVDVGGIQL